MSESSEFQVGDRVRVNAGYSNFQGSTGTVVSIYGAAHYVQLDKPAVTSFFHADELQLVGEIPLHLWIDDVKRQEDLPEKFGETRVVNEKTGGAKGSKPQRFSLLPWDVLSKLAEHYAKGAAKYGEDHNWRRGYDWSLSIDALGRHLAAFIEGETYDPETGSHHMLAVMFHAASLVYFTDEFPELDNRRKAKDGQAQ